MKKRFLSILMCLVMALAMLPAAAEQTQEMTPGQRLDAFLDALNSWMGEASDEVTKAAETASEWTGQQWQNAKEKVGEAVDWLGSNIDQAGQSARSLGEKAAQWLSENWQGVENWVSETWNTVKGGSSQFFGMAKERLEALEKDAGKLSQVLASSGRIIVREALLEYADMLEKLAAEHQTAIPENIQAAINDLRKAAYDSTSPEATLDEESLKNYLASMGVDKETFEQAYEAGLKKRMISVLVTAENACLSKYMAENGLTFSSAALRAQDRLNRYAAGTLEMTDEELEKAANIVTEWCDQTGIPEDDLAMEILQYAENMNAQQQ